jgi:hypothetical protein
MLTRASPSPLQLDLISCYERTKHYHADLYLSIHAALCPLFSQHANRLYCVVSQKYDIGYSLQQNVFPKLETLHLHLACPWFQDDHIMMSELIDPLNFPSIKALAFTNCFLPPNIVQSPLFLNLVKLDVQCNEEFVGRFNDPYPLPVLDFESLMFYVPKLESLSLWNVFHFLIEPPTLSIKRIIALPPLLRDLTLVFDQESRYVPQVLPLLEAISLPSHIDVRIDLFSRSKTCNKLSAFLGGARLPLRVHLSIQSNFSKVAFYQLTYASAPLTNITMSRGPLTTLGFESHKANPLDALPLSAVTHLLFTYVLVRNMCDPVKDWWRGIFARASRVHTLQLSLDDHWFPPAIRALADADALPLLETLVLIDPREPEPDGDGDEHDPGSAGAGFRMSARSKRLDAVRLCLDARARSGSPVRILALPWRFEREEWAEEMRWRVERLVFGGEMSVQG